MRDMEISQVITKEGKYRLTKPFTYYSPRYKKHVTVDPDMYDGATGASDINTAGWWVHDQLCKTGKWDDGTPINNWECSQVLQDILKSENRWFRARTWFWATWIFGGDKARKNGMW